MSKKILFLFFILLSMFALTVQAKYAFKKEIILANLDIDNVNPKVELMSIKNILKKENDQEFYYINIQIKVVESNIKVDNINNLILKIDDNEIKDYDVKKLEDQYNQLIYEINIKKLLKGQKIKLIIQKGTIIDKYNNTNDEKIIEHKIE